MNKISLVTGIGGIVIILLSIQRWWIVYYDPSQMIFGSMIGLVILGSAYLHHWMKLIEIEQRKLIERVENIAKWWIKQELKP